MKPSLGAPRRYLTVNSQRGPACVSKADDTAVFWETGRAKTTPGAGPWEPGRLKRGAESETECRTQAVLFQVRRRETGGRVGTEPLRGVGGRGVGGVFIFLAANRQRTLETLSTGSTMTALYSDTL